MKAATTSRGLLRARPHRLRVTLADARGLFEMIGLGALVEESAADCPRALLMSAICRASAVQPARGRPGVLASAMATGATA